MITEKIFEDDVEQMLLSGGWSRGDGKTFDRELALDIPTLMQFIQTTQANEWQKLCKLLGNDAEKIFVNEFCAQIEQTNIIQILRDGFGVRGCKFRAVYWRPEAAINPALVKHYKQNILTVVRQLHYSAQSRKSLDVVLFVNGLPLVTIELKNPLTGQNVDDAIEQYKRDRDPSEKVFQFGRRAVIHFAVDPYNAAVTTKLAGAATKFLPFNQGSNGAGKVGGAGNPSTTAYLWQEILCKDTLLEILQKYLLCDAEKIIFPRYHQLDVVTKLLADVRKHGTGRNYLIQHSAGSGKSNSIAWLAHRLASLHNAADEKIFNSVLVVTDRRVLDQQLQNTVAQFEQTPGLVVKVDTSAKLRDAINSGKKIIVTTLQKFPVIFKDVDAVNKKFAIIVDEAHSSQSGSSAAKMKRSLTDKKKSRPIKNFFDDETVDYLENLMDFVDIYEKADADYARAVAERIQSENILAVIAFSSIEKDEAASDFIQKNIPMNEVEHFLAEYIGANSDSSDKLNFSRDELEKFFVEYSARKVPQAKKVSSFAPRKMFVSCLHQLIELTRAAHNEKITFDAEDELLDMVKAQGRQENLSYFAFTATPKPRTLQVFGTRRNPGGRAPFHIYSMRQAIAEGFILDVLKNYVTYKTFYRIGKNSPENPIVDKARAVAEIEKFVSLHPCTIKQKTEIIMKHFVENTRQKIGGRAKAMLVTASRLHAVRYFHAIKRYIAENNLSGVGVLVAFSGIVEDGPNIFIEKNLNGFAEEKLKEIFHGDKYNILVVAEKYQTGFDEPLLHTMFVDKKLAGVKAVQTLSRLNRTCAGKVDTFILDFINDAADIQKSFQPFYETTVLTADTDPKVVYALKKKLDDFEIYDGDDIATVCKIFLATGEKNSERVYKILQRPLDKFLALDEEQRATFKKTLNQFNRVWSVILQVNRLFDKNLQRFALFADLFAKILPSRKLSTAEIKKLLELEFYRTEEIFSGTIELESDEKIHTVEPPKVSDVNAGDRPENPLNKIIHEINAIYGTNFTSGDKVFAEILRGFLTDLRALNCAKNNNATMFRSMVYEELFREKISFGLTKDPALAKFIAGNEEIIPWIGDEIFPAVYAALKAS